MTRRNNQSTKTVRVNRIERLESRQMLSADGLSCNGFHEEFTNELARSASSLEALRGSEFDSRDAERIRDSHGSRESDRNRGGRRSDGDHTLRLNRDGFDLRDQDRVRSSFSEGRHGKVDRQLWRQSRLYQPQLDQPQVIFPTADLSGAEGELAANSRLPFASTSIQTTTAATIPSSITTSRITFVIFLPITISSYSPDFTASRSTSNTLVRPQSTPAPPRAAAETESPATSPIIEDSDQSQAAHPESTSTAQIANENAFRQTDSVQLVSFRPATDLFTRTTTIDASPENLSAEVAESAHIEFTFDRPHLGDSALNQLLEQSKSLEDDFTKLEALLDAIALERLDSPQHRDRVAASWTPADEDVDGTAQPTAESVSDGMILLLPGASLAHPTSQLVAQAFELPEDSAINQWTVGVGFYRALEVVGDIRFADALIAAEISVDPVNTTGEQNEITDAFAWQADSAASSRQAAGLVFCCLGIQYLRKRRKERKSDPIALRLGNAPGEGKMN